MNFEALEELIGGEELTKFLEEIVDLGRELLGSAFNPFLAVAVDLVDLSVKTDVEEVKSGLIDLIQTMPAAAVKGMLPCLIFGLVTMLSGRAQELLKESGRMN